MYEIKGSHYGQLKNGMIGPTLLFRNPRHGSFIFSLILFIQLLLAWTGTHSDYLRIVCIKIVVNM